MRLEVHLSLDGAAFADGMRDYEVAQILRTLGEKFTNGMVPEDEVVRLYDANGNRCGYAVVTDNDGGCGDPDCSCPECPTGRENEPA